MVDIKKYSNTVQSAWLPRQTCCSEQWGRAKIRKCHCQKDFGAGLMLELGANERVTLLERRCQDLCVAGGAFL